MDMSWAQIFNLEEVNIQIKFKNRRYAVVKTIELKATKIYKSKMWGKNRNGKLKDNTVD